MKPSLLIISDTIRSDLHRPLGLFKRFRVTHAYRQASYSDMTRADFAAVPAIQFRTPFELLKLLSSLKPSIVQLPEPTAGRRAAVTTAILLKPAKRLGAKLVVPFFENLPLEGKFSGLNLKLIQLVTRQVIRQADLLIYLNQGARRNLIKLGAPQAKLKRLFWGSWGTGEHFRPNSKIKNQNAKLKTVIYVGVISRRKGIEYLVEAMERVIKKLPKVQLWLVGPPGDFQPPRRTWIKVFGPVKNRQLPKFFQRATVSVLPSVSTQTWQEQVGMVNLQALACGTPVVTTRSGAIPEFVKGGEGVILVPEKNPAALARVLIKLLNLSPLKLKTFGLAGRKFAIRRYQVANNVKKAEQTLLRLLKN